MKTILLSRGRRAFGVAVACAVIAAGAIVMLKSSGAASGESGTAPGFSLSPHEEPPPRALQRGEELSFSSSGLTGTVRLTQEAVLAQGNRRVYAEIEMETDTAESGPRRPVALAVVLDVSGSMSGEKLEEARRAVSALLARMQDGDLLSLVTYSDSAALLQSLAPVGDIRARLLTHLMTLTASGGTNIPRGLMSGSKQLDRADHDFVRRLVLVSDGLDHSEMPIPQVSGMVREQAGSGMTFSTLGVGTDYSEAFLTAVANAGRGNYEFLARADQLQHFLHRELEQGASTTVDELLVELRLPASWRVKKAYDVEISGSTGTVRVPFGSMHAGEKRRAVLALDVNAGVPGQTLAFEAGSGCGIPVTTSLASSSSGRSRSEASPTDASSSPPGPGKPTRTRSQRPSMDNRPVPSTPGERGELPRRSPKPEPTSWRWSSSNSSPPRRSASRSSRSIGEISITLANCRRSLRQRAPTVSAQTALVARHGLAKATSLVIERADDVDCEIRLPASELLEGVELCYPPAAVAAATALGDDDVVLQSAALVGLMVIVTLAGLAMQRATRRAEELSSQKSSFISSVSHELRTPLTTIRMHAEMLRDGLVPETKRDKFHRQLVHESVRLSRLVENVLELSRLEEGRRVLRRQLSDLTKYVAEAIEEQRPYVEEKGFTLVGPRSDVEVSVAFDAQAVSQIVINLIDNAVKYGKGETNRVEIEVVREQGLAVLVVSDKGTGIPLNQSEQVFDRFHRIRHPEQEHMPGTGIGLSLVRELARAHKGDAEVRDTQDGGCEVRVLFPLEVDGRTSQE